MTTFTPKGFRWSKYAARPKRKTKRKKSTTTTTRGRSNAWRAYVGGGK
jgi:hypothetical protein